MGFKAPKQLVTREREREREREKERESERERERECFTRVGRSSADDCGGVVCVRSKGP